jgi:DNA-binding SARP family transcriptional activator
MLVAGREAPLRGAKPHILMAALPLDANTVVSVDRLVENLWSSEPPDHAASVPAKYVYRLQAVIDDERSGGEPQGLL